MIDLFGYLGVGLGLFAITKKKINIFRFWHIVSCISYIVYGLLIHAYPIVFSGTAYVLIHLWRVFRRG